MATYNPTGHALLSAAATALDTADLTAQADMAEALIGSRLSDLDDDTALLAVVHQVNHQVERGSEFGIESWSRGARSVSYAKGAGGGGGVLAPLTVALLNRTTTWPTAGSLR